jgi:hypothetical protein
MRAALICLLAACLLPFAVMPIACADDDDSGSDSDGDSDSDSDSDSDTDSDAEGDATVSGSASRDYGSCPPSQDGIGDLCMFLLADCDDLGSEVASAVVTAANMSNPSATIAYSIEGVPDGTFQLFGFLDDDSSGCDGGATSGDFWPNGCVEVTVTDQQDVTGANIHFASKCP